MKRSIGVIAIVMAGLVSGCASDGHVTRGDGLSGALLGSKGTSAAVPLNSSVWRIVSVDVAVPHSLVVSEANTYKPRADIVWREDPPGDRYAQVDTIVTDALNRAAGSFRSGRPVKLVAEVTRFHALTQKTRYSFGGSHEVNLLVSLVDPASGDVLVPAQEIGFDIHAAGGDEAIAEEMAGITQRVVITNALVELIRTRLGGSV